MGQESVTVAVEYQWLPPKCNLCKMFGHTCKPKAVPVATNNEEAWKLIGEALGGGGDALAAVTKVVPLSQPDKGLGMDMEVQSKESAAEGEGSFLSNPDCPITVTQNPSVSIIDRRVEVSSHVPQGSLVPLSNKCSPNPNTIKYQLP